MEEEFYASIKLKHSGEEIFTKVCASEEEDRTMLVLSNPIVVEEIKFRGKPAGYKMEPWLKTSTQDMFVINLSDVLTMSESADIQMIMYYEDYVSKSNKTAHCDLDRKMGYLGTVEETKKSLEKLFEAS
ncbi:hypothetical protein OAF61_01975 [Pseudomonadales bacterium]|nr:hypothetical protein [Pseudomonadales bacterium]